MRILPYGDRALLAEVDSLEHAVALAAALDGDLARVPGVQELVPGARTVLVRIDPRTISLTAAERWIVSTEAAQAPFEHATVVTIPVRYDGPDLREAAELLGLTPDELAARHAEARWHAAFVGFAPGFAYLTSPEFAADVPRRATSRPRVPAGSVGLAGEFSGIYPRESPGGWQLIGTTDVALWDAARTPPALIPPGTEVRFRPVDP
jgi:KipI family sensor histidine kinase inhibitor